MQGLNGIMRKESRLRNPLDFRKAFREGKRFKSPHFALYIRRNSLVEGRFGVSFSKAHCKLATRRNRLRRIAKEEFRNNVAPGFKGYDFAVASRASYRHLDIEKIAGELKQLIGGTKG